MRCFPFNLTEQNIYVRLNSQILPETYFQKHAIGNTAKLGSTLYCLWKPERKWFPTVLWLFFFLKRRRTTLLIWAQSEVCVSNMTKCPTVQGVWILSQGNVKLEQRWSRHLKQGLKKWSGPRNESGMLLSFVLFRLHCPVIPPITGPEGDRDEQNGKKNNRDRGPKRKATERLNHNQQFEVKQINGTWWHIPTNGQSECHFKLRHDCIPIH